MSPLATLIDIYQKRGFEICVGLNPGHFSGIGNRGLPFAAIKKYHKTLQTGGGISLQEIYFFENLFSVYHPQNIFIIGNAFGWSTILFSLLNPNAKVIAIDAGMEGDDNDFGINLTNQIAKEEDLTLKVIKGFSPNDVESIVSNELDGRIDCCFIDGLHTNSQQYLDFKACEPFFSKESIIVFHDVINWKMQDSFSKISREATDFTAKLFYSTTSGMGILYPRLLEEKIVRHIDCFYVPDEMILDVKKKAKLYRYFGWIPFSLFFYRLFQKLTSSRKIRL